MFFFITKTVSQNSVPKYNFFFSKNTKNCSKKLFFRTIFKNSNHSFSYYFRLLNKKIICFFYFCLFYYSLLGSSDTRCQKHGPGPTQYHPISMVFGPNPIYYTKDPNSSLRTVIDNTAHGHVEKALQFFISLSLSNL